MLGPDVLVRKPLGFLSRVSQHALAFVGKRQVNRGRYLLADGGVPFNLLADRFHRGMRTQKPIGQRLVFAQQAKQQVLGLNVRTPELARLIPGEEYYATSFLGVALEHLGNPLSLLGSMTDVPDLLPGTRSDDASAVEVFIQSLKSLTGA